MSLTWKGYILEEDETHFTIITNRDTKIYRLEKVQGQVPVGNTFLQDGTVVYLYSKNESERRLLTAIKAYNNTLERQQRKRTNAKKEKDNQKQPQDVKIQMDGKTVFLID